MVPTHGLALRLLESSQVPESTRSPGRPRCHQQRSCGERRGMRLSRGSVPPRSLWRVVSRSALAPLAVLGVVVVAACSSSTPSPTSSQQSKNLTVWVDAVRLPVAQAYVKAHPELHVDVVTYDGDGNGAT